MASVSELITSAANPRAKQALKLRKSRDRRKTGLFLAEGFREVGRAIEAQLNLRTLFVCPELIGPEGEAWTDHLSTKAQVVRVEQGLFTQMAYRAQPEGLLAVVEQPEWSLEDLPDVTDQTLVLVAVGTAKPGNLGAMARSADAAGATVMLSPDLAVDPFNPNAIRASTGAVFSLPIVQATPGKTIAWLKSRRIRIVAATPQAPCTHTEADLTGPLAIVIGPEDTGLDHHWLDTAGEPEPGQARGFTVRIPIQGRTTDSLNAANAAAVLLFEALRQRQAQNANRPTPNLKSQSSNLKSER